MRDGGTGGWQLCEECGSRGGERGRFVCDGGGWGGGGEECESCSNVVVASFTQVMGQNKYNV